MNKATSVNLFVFFLVLNQLTIGQVIENFNDGNFTVNPTWIGDDSLFTVNTALQLQSKGTAGTSKDICLSTANYQLKNAEFSCLVRFNLNPSTQNFCRFYLVSDAADLKQNLNGYYIQFGGSTGNTDSVTLWRQVGSNRTRILASRPAIVGKNTNIVSVKVLVDDDCNFKLFTDTTGNNDFIFEGQVRDTLINSGFFSGVFVKFTSTNVSNYYFDDVYIGQERVDSIAPNIILADFVNDTLLKIVCNEKLNSAILDTNRYLLNGKKFKQIIFGNVAQTELHLFCNTLQNGTNNYLEVFALEDVYGNTANDTAFNIVFFEPNINDIIITELMPDPDPPLGLPNAEYVEIYNNSAFTINLNGWTISDPSSTALLGNITLQPDSFLIICSAINAPLFINYGKVAVVLSLPTLNNSGDELWIKNKTSKTINYLKYDLNYYNNPNKSNGGFSLEMLNPFEICKQQKNWQASESALGGTPGFINAYFVKTPDITAPQINYADFIDSLTILCVFSEPIVSNTNTKILVNMVTQNNYSINNDSLIVKLTSSVQKNSINKVEIIGIADCLNNTKTNQITLNYIPSSTPFQNQIVVSEIMHTPSKATTLPDVEYIELYNNSTEAFNLNGCILTDGSSTAILPNYKLYPDSFVVICATNNTAWFPNLKNVMGVKNFPNFSSTDKVVLKNNLGYLIHSVYYNADWHKDKLKQTLGGYSLEIINPKNPCAKEVNWRASINKNGGTPGFVNSISGTNKDFTAPILNRIYPFGSNKLKLYFNETLDSLSVHNATLNLVEHNNTIKNWRFTNDEYNTVEITFEKDFEAEKNYTLNTKNFCDCALNKQTETNLNFGLLIKPDSGNIIINEVLFNPYVNGSDFVELYNTTNNYLDLKYLLFANTNSNKTLKDIKPIIAEGYLLEPKDYVVFTTDINNIISNYFVANKHKVIYAILPSMNDDEGSIILLDSIGKVYDALFYTDKMHNALIPKIEGVSLEKVNPFLSSAEPSNWQSAAATVGFATPTYKNSQYNLGSKHQNVLSVVPEVFTPNQDGINDVIAFTINLPDVNFNFKLNLYNSSGILVKQLTSFANGGINNTIYWNGVTDNNQKADIGIYMANLEAFNLKGETINTTVTFVVAEKF